MRSPEAALALVGKQGLGVDTEVLWRRTRLMRKAWRVRHCRTCFLQATRQLFSSFDDLWIEVTTKEYLFWPIPEWARVCVRAVHCVLCLKQLGFKRLYKLCRAYS